MNLDEVFPGKWIRARHLRGKKKTLTITGAQLEKFNDGDPVVALSFEQTSMKFGCNATNRNTCRDSFGPITDDWVGKKITLYPTKTDYQGKIVDCVRIEIPPQADLPKHKEVFPDSGFEDDGGEEPPF